MNDINYKISSLSIRSINNYEITDLYSLTNDEIVLKLTQNTIDDIALRLNIDNDIDVFKQYVYKNEVLSYLDLANLEWIYTCNVNFKI